MIITRMPIGDFLKNTRTVKSIFLTIAVAVSSNMPADARSHHYMRHFLAAGAIGGVAAYAGRRGVSSAAESLDPPDSVYPNKSLTPGALLPVTAADICVIGRSTITRNGGSRISGGSGRHGDDQQAVDESVRRAVFARYHVHNRRGKYEVDHLVALEEGGSNSLLNLWPQPKHAVWNAYAKDHLENRLHSLVCRRDNPMPLAVAQSALANDWIAAYKQYIGPSPTENDGSYRN